MSKRKSCLDCACCAKITPEQNSFVCVLNPPTAQLLPNKNGGYDVNSFYPIIGDVTFCHQFIEDTDKVSKH